MALNPTYRMFLKLCLTLSYRDYQIKCWFLRRGENRIARRKTSQSRVENQQTQPTYDARSGNRIRGTLVEGERSHHCANPAPRHLLLIFCISSDVSFPNQYISALLGATNLFLHEVENYCVKVGVHKCTSI